jgi:hypothetical protein
MKMKASGRHGLITGVIGGSVLGFLAAYLFARAAEEGPARDGGKPEKVKTTQLLSVALAVLGVIRKVAEMGRPPKS